MPTEPAAVWWPVLWVCLGIVAIAAPWFTRWILSRLEKDRSRLHRHGSVLHQHELRIETLERDVDGILSRPPRFHGIARPEPDAGEGDAD